MKPIAIPAKLKPILIFLVGMAFGALGTVAGPFAPVVKMLGEVVVTEIQDAPEPTPSAAAPPETGPEVQGGQDGGGSGSLDP